MSVDELTRAQLQELKARFYEEHHPEGVSYGELAQIDELVSDAEVMEEYSGVVFTEEDFFTGEEG